MMRLLADLGKTVLRPGGLALTRRLLRQVDIDDHTRIIELGAGSGATARLLINRRPASYTAVEADQPATEHLRTLLHAHQGTACQVRHGLAQQTGLPDRCADLVVAEAFLSSLEHRDKEQVVAEASRLLVPGGRLVLHEFELTEPAHYAGPLTPLTSEGWTGLLAEADLEVDHIDHEPLGFLETERVIADEGAEAADRFFANLKRHPEATAQLHHFATMIEDMKPTVRAIGLTARRLSVATGCGWRGEGIPHAT